MARAPSFCGVILAAGASSRMGRTKALLPWRTGTFLSGAIEVLNAHTDMVIVVAGANSTELLPAVDAAGGFLVVNPHPEQGQFSSLRAGVQEVLNRGRDAAIITLSDRPAPHWNIVAQLRQAFLDHLDDNIWAAVPEYQGRHGHPIVVGREMIGAFLDAQPTANARDMLRAHQQQVLYVPVDDRLVVANVDTPEDYQTLIASASVISR